ncbi:hypothetical protein Gotur_030611 [Gossypium turneri]
MLEKLMKRSDSLFLYHC